MFRHIHAVSVSTDSGNGLSAPLQFEDYANEADANAAKAKVHAAAEIAASYAGYSRELVNVVVPV